MTYLVRSVQIGEDLSHGVPAGPYRIRIHIIRGDVVGVIGAVTKDAALGALGLVRRGIFDGENEVYVSVLLPGTFWERIQSEGCTGYILTETEVLTESLE